MDLAMTRQAVEKLDGVFRRDMVSLPAAAWEQPSDCAGWTIAAAFIHVVQVCELLQDSLKRGRAGDAGPPPLAAQEGVQAWRAARAERQKLALTQTPAELLAWYERAMAAMNAELDAIPTAAPGAQGWHPVGARPLSWVQDQWLFELALHDWDIRVALDSAAGIRPDVEAAFARTLPDRLGRGFAAADDPAAAGTYRIEVAADPPLTVTVAVGDGALTIVPSDGSTPTATIRTDATAFGLVTTTRRPVDQFTAGGRWQVSGDTARAEAFARGFRSY